MWGRPLSTSAINASSSASTTEAVGLLGTSTSTSVSTTSNSRKRGIPSIDNDSATVKNSNEMIEESGNANNSSDEPALKRPVPTFGNSNSSGLGGLFGTTATSTVLTDTPIQTEANH